MESSYKSDERIVNEENDWDHNVDGDAVDCVYRDEAVQLAN